MRINKKLIKKRAPEEDNIKITKRNLKLEPFDIIKAEGVKYITPFSIIITTSSDKKEQLYDCFYYLNQCFGINNCQVVLILYQDAKEEYDFNQFNNLNIKLIHSRRNNYENKFCLSHARNIGLKNSTYDWVLCLDGDILVPSNLCQVLTYIKPNDPMAIYRTKRANIESHSGRKPITYFKNKIKSFDVDFVGYFHFYNRKKAMELIGGYDEEMVGWGREDCDFIMRCGLSGMKVKYIDYVLAYHVEHGHINPLWKDKYSDFRNHSIQNKNLVERRIMKKNIGSIL